MKFLIGMGSHTMSDDAIGLRVAEALSSLNFEGVEIGDVGHDALRLIDYFRDKNDEILIVDCVEFGGKPGDYIFFEPAQVESKKAASRLTTHEGDALKAIQMARELGYHLPKIKIMGIQPATMTPGLEISPELAKRFDEYVSVAKGQLMGNASVSS